MSDAIFPSVPGLTWELTASPTWSTEVQRSKNGATTRLGSDPYPLWKFELNYEFLRDSRPARGATPQNPRGVSELQQIVNFYNARRGSWDDFLLDPSLLTGRRGVDAERDSMVSGARLGVGDGANRVFYLQRDCGGFVDEVQNPVGPVYVAVDNVAQTSGWTLGDAGAVTFDVAPALGEVVTADFRWRWRVRFAEDQLDFEAFMYQLYELKSVKLEQVKL